MCVPVPKGLTVKSLKVVCCYLNIKASMRNKTDLIDLILSTLQNRQHEVRRSDDGSGSADVVMRGRRRRKKKKRKRRKRRDTRERKLRKINFRMKLSHWNTTVVN